MFHRLVSPSFVFSIASLANYPPGTSKWNQIEHRLFSFISLNFVYALCVRAM